MQVTPYTERHAAAWAALLRESVNGTCFHDHAFLDYHPAGRFHWHHLLFGNAGQPDALLPGALLRTVDGKTIFQSPAGATLGGFALRPHTGLEATIALVEGLLEYARGQGLARIVLGTVPSVYWESSDDMLEFLLAAQGFQCSRQLMYYVNLKRLPLPDILEGLPGPRRSSFRKALKQGMEPGIAESDAEVAAFYEVLCANKAIHDQRPVHSLQEILDLRRRLGQRLRIFTAMYDGKLVGGVQCLAVNARTSYCQYIADAPDYRHLEITRFALFEMLKVLRAEGVCTLDMGPSVQIPIAKVTGGRFKESFGAIGCERRSWALEL